MQTTQDIPGSPSSGAGVVDGRERFLLTLARAMAAYGIPAHRLEEAASHCASHFGVRAQFFATPTAVFAAIGQDEDQRTHLVRLEPGEVNLEKQWLVDEVLREVLAGRLMPDEATARLRAIVARPPRYGPGMLVACQTLASMAASVFFGGGWRELVAAGVVGFVVGSLCVLAAAHRRVSRVIEFASGLAAALLASAFVVVFHARVSPEVIVLAGIIVLIPGLTLTTSVAELASRHLAAGTARLMGALTIFVSIGFGVALGHRLAELAFDVGSSVGVPFPAYAVWIALAVSPAALAVLFQARPREIQVILPCGVIGFAGARFGAAWLGPELGAFVGALAVGLAANAYARVADRPAGVVLVPGIMLLVPGSLGFRSVASFVENDTLGGVDAAAGAALVAVGLVVGLILANVALPPRRPL